MEKDVILQIIFKSLGLLNQARDEDDKIPVSADTILFGTNGYLDSMSLVSLLIDIEESLQNEGLDVSLSDERAMSERNSPFRDVPALAEYIDKLISPSTEDYEHE